MKHLTFKLVIPLTIISFASFTKWWYALPADAPDTIFTGFPFPFVCQGWHTSMSLQIFLIEFFADLLIYFLGWFILLLCVDRFAIKIKTHKIVTICLWILSVLFIAFSAIAVSNKDNLFYIKRPFDMEVKETGYKFVWQDVERPDFYKFQPKNK